MVKSKTSLKAALVFITLFIALTFLVFTGKTEAFDQAFSLWAINLRSDFLTTVAMALDVIGSAKVIVMVNLLLLILPQTRLKWGVLVSLTTGIAAIACAVLKELFQRPRPEVGALIMETSFSFPSGHSTNNMAFYCILVLLTLRYATDKRVKIAAVAGGLYMSLAIGFSRVYLGVHYVSDVMAGFLLGLAIAFFINGMLKQIYLKTDESESQKPHGSRGFEKKLTSIFKLFTIATDKTVN